MGLLNLTDSEKRAIAAINSGELDELIDSAIRFERFGELSRLPLRNCGEFVSGRLRYFEEALAAYRIAKSVKNREAKLYSARKAGSDLSFAVDQMKQRLEVEERENHLFYVFDPVFTPFNLSENMHVRVSYRWRRRTEDEWTSGSILFKYNARPRIDNYWRDKSRRKPSAKKLADDRETDLRHQWEHLVQLAHWSVRDYFREGKDGFGIPDMFEIKVKEGGHLNNFSANFWQRKPDF
ncbi:hypothetical protein [Stappia sp.]|uniref:hypothetical protein n=1 Tax=Stappia sp. TaxID=1870903 RepID=UPI003D0D8113